MHLELPMNERLSWLTVGTLVLVLVTLYDDNTRIYCLGCACISISLPKHGVEQQNLLGGLCQLEKLRISILGLEPTNANK